MLERECVLSEGSWQLLRTCNCSPGIVAELAIEKGAETLLIPIASRRQLNDLSDEMAMRLSILYYADPREALLKALAE